MKTKLPSTLVLLLTCCPLLASTITLHVDPKGNDTWSGRRSSYGGIFKKDGPLATLPHALEVARQLRGEPGAKGIKIQLHGGDYFLQKPLTLLPSDSGITITGPGTISGGVRVTNWFAGSINGRTALIANVPEGLVFHQLWVNGKRAIRARHPNTNYFSIETVPDRASSWQEGQARFTWKPGDIPDWTEIDPEAKCVVMCRWVESHLPIATIQRSNRMLTFAKKSVFQIEPGNPYYLEGLIDAIDATGEWFLDSRRHTVYYLPRPGEAPENVEAIAPVISELLRIEGDPARSAFVTNVTLENLRFSHTEWNYPKPPDSGQLEPGGSVQAAYTVPSAIHAMGLLQSTIQGCTFAGLGNYALELTSGCRSNKIQKCDFTDLGGGGIKIGEPAIRPAPLQTSANEISDCRIKDGGKIFQSAVGVWIGQSPGNSLLRNEISDLYYTGISVGWTWGYGPALATNNLIARNHVHHIGKKSDGDGPILSDMGGIYTLGMQPGTRILGNVWHDVAALYYGGWGIYFDEGSSSILAASNIVYNTTHGGFHQHYGATNTVRNNIFAFSRDHQIQRTRPEPHISFHFQTNIVVIDRGLFLGGNWDGRNFDLGHNVYFDTRPGGETNKTFAGITFEDFQTRGLDTDSVFADPKFRNLRGFDFRLERNSPALKQGFRPIKPAKE